MPLSFENGLPRGLSISSVMSELYMKYFDLRIRRLEGVYYYARFVDDIVVFVVMRRRKRMHGILFQNR